MWLGNPSTSEPNMWDQSHLAYWKRIGAKQLGLTENHKFKKICLKGDENFSKFIWFFRYSGKDVWNAKYCLDSWIASEIITGRNFDASKQVTSMNEAWREPGKRIAAAQSISNSLQCKN